MTLHQKSNLGGPTRWQSQLMTQTRWQWPMFIGAGHMLTNFSYRQLPQSVSDCPVQLKVASGHLPGLGFAR